MLFRTHFADNIKTAALQSFIVADMRRLTRLPNELYSDLFHAVLAWNCGRAKCQCCTATDGDGCCLLLAVKIECTSQAPASMKKPFLDFFLF